MRRGRDRMLAVIGACLLALGASPAPAYAVSVSSRARDFEDGLVTLILWLSLIGIVLSVVALIVQHTTERARTAAREETRRILEAAYRSDQRTIAERTAAHGLEIKKDDE